MTEQFGLASAVSDQVVAQAKAAIGADLSDLDGRTRPKPWWAWAAP